LTSALEGGGWSAPCPGRFTPGKDPVPIVQVVGWDPGPVWTYAKKQVPGSTSNAGTVPQIAGHYTSSLAADAFFHIFSHDLFTSHPIFRAIKSELLIVLLYAQTIHTYLCICIFRLTEHTFEYIILYSGYMFRLTGSHHQAFKNIKLKITVLACTWYPSVTCVAETVLNQIEKFLQHM
jgi:hypothetical protein